MIAKYHYVWEIHITSDELEELKRFYEKVARKNERAKELVKESLNIIDKATYMPYIITTKKSDGTYERLSKEEEKFLEDLADYKSTYLDKLRSLGEDALYDKILEPDDFMILEDLLYRIKHANEKI